mmetsp:Transcript_41907/g.98317  ORF Transcript_41907/g.98317 Transcript_41907/m.98317 type:complete len:222 (+) Transcript_41907:1893-2558(+)
MRAERNLFSVRGPAGVPAKVGVRRRRSGRGDCNAGERHPDADPSELGHCQDVGDVPDGLPRVDEHGADAGGDPVQQHAQGHQLDVESAAQGAERHRRHVCGARCHRDLALQQPGSGQVGRQGLPLAQTARVMADRSRGALEVCARLDGQRPPCSVLDLRLLLPASVPHRCAAELREKAPVRHRPGDLRPRLQRRPGQGHGGETRGRMHHLRAVHGIVSVGP